MIAAEEIHPIQPGHPMGDKMVIRLFVTGLFGDPTNNQNNKRGLSHLSDPSNASWDSGG
jgi:hypothetical protein